MAILYETSQQIIENAKGRTYTTEEAREFMREVVDKMPTGAFIHYHWYDVKTKRPVAFSY